jgi:hypothetical protein
MVTTIAHEAARKQESHVTLSGFADGAVALKASWIKILGLMLSRTVNDPKALAGLASSQDIITKSENRVQRRIALT